MKLNVCGNTQLVLPVMLSDPGCKIYFLFTDCFLNVQETVEAENPAGISESALIT